MNADELFRGRLIMAPMTRGTDLPFRLLANEWGAEICLGEMAYAHKTIGRERGDLPLLRRHPSEKIFGAQLAGKIPEVMAESARVAQDQGADFVDVNCGCPIDEVTRRGFGASLLRKPAKIAAVVAAMKKAVTVPVTIKLRLGWSEGDSDYLKVARAATEAGADAITLHARSRAQRYRRAADWDHVKALVETVQVPVIGNGDVFTWHDAQRRIEETGCAGVMVGRWALAKPWIFREYAERRDLDLDVEARLAVLKRYVEICRGYFRDDEKGRARTRRFFVFHQDFFRRYRRHAERDAVNADDPRAWGDAPAGDLEAWLCRADAAGVDALARWLVDGEETAPPPEAVDAPRAVKVAALG
ncbi:MAG TPA: tRNA-dihydrouridine synthase family protein [Candidatus Polarisedimenticolaceae bacterium]|nr:tRNA-dihydrouridine synthase family protein [Candidatus Polarisedimenticolaceae bacterium]